MAEQLSEGFQIAAVAEEFAGEGATEIVSGHAASPDAGLPRARLCDLVDALAADPPAIPAGE